MAIDGVTDTTARSPCEPAPASRGAASVAFAGPRVAYLTRRVAGCSDRVCLAVVIADPLRVEGSVDEPVAGVLLRVDHCQDDAVDA
jgi:hypothetical protein